MAIATHHTFHTIHCSWSEIRPCGRIPVLIVFFLPLPTLLFSQNLVTNPSFEQGSDPCDFTILPYFYDTNVRGWWIPTNSTADVFSTNIPNKYCWASMPAAQEPPRYPDAPQVGNQLPRTGNRFIGLFTFSRNINIVTNEPLDTTYREYVETKLLSPLIPGEYYCAEMYVSLGEHPHYASNNLGMYFHETETKQRHWISANPQVNEKEIITNTLGWEKVAGVFRPDAPLEYLTLGNFFGYHDTKVSEKPGTHPDAASYDNAYYFIDDVSVDKYKRKSFEYSGNTTICKGESATIRISGGLEKITWSTLSDTLTALGSEANFIVSPSVTTSYLIKAKDCGMTVKDTLTITVKPGLPANLGNNQTICKGTSLQLDAGAGNATYKWQDESQDRFYTVTKAGAYSVWVENENGCRYYDDIVISMIDKPTVDLGKDTLVCGNYPKLRTGYSSEVSYEWSTGSVSHEITPNTSGSYWVSLKNICGEARDTINIYSPEEVFMPNVVTPNSDGKNDTFVVTGIPQGQDIWVYNRWGTEVFHSSNYDNDWPLENEGLSAGVYYFKMTSPGCKTFNGWLHVIKE